MLKIYNDIFNQYIMLNNKYIDIYCKLLNIPKITNFTDFKKLEWLPYQITYANTKIVYFGKRTDMIEFIKNKNLVDNFLNKYRDRNKLPLDLTSYKDFFKMNDQKIPLENRFKYLYLVDTKAKNFFPFLANNINTIYNINNIDRIIIPATNKTYTINNYKKLGNLYVLDDFIEYITLHPNLDKIDKGYIIYNLFFGFNNFSLLNDDIIKKNATDGFNEEELKLILKIRKNNINKYTRLTKGIENNFEEAYLNFRNDLSNTNNIDELINNYQDYFLKYEDVRRKHSLNEKIELLNYDSNYSNFKEECNDIILSKEDSINCPSIHTCIKILEYINNDNIKNNLINYINDVKNTGNFCLKDFDKNININNIYEEYIPEWYKLVENNEIPKAFNKRQFILGDHTYTSFMKHCSLIFRADPFVSGHVNINALTWSEFVNKFYISCLVNKDIIFPIRIIGDIDVSRYRQVNLDNNDILIGSFIKKHNYNGKIVLDNKLLYYNKDAKFFKNNTNFRSLSTFHSQYSSESFKVLYIELSILQYIEHDQGIKLYYYKITNTDHVLVSKYNKNEIFNKYVQLGFTQEKTLQILNLLQTVNLTKNLNKIFIYENVNNNNLNNNNLNNNNLNNNNLNIDTVNTINNISNNNILNNDMPNNNILNMLNNKVKQLGGNKKKIRKVYLNNEYKFIGIDKLNTEFKVKFSINNNVINSDIFPIDKYIKYINKRQENINLMGDASSIYRTLGTFKYFIYGKRSYFYSNNETFKIDNINIINFKNPEYNKINNFLNTLSEKDFLLYDQTKYLLPLAISINKNINIDDTNNVLVFSKNIYSIYTLNNFKDIYLFNYTYSVDNFLTQEVKNFVKNKKNIHYNEITKTLNLENVSIIDNDIKKYNKPFTLAIIDLWVNNNEFTNLRNIISFQINVSLIYLVLNNLIIGGDLIIHYPIITSKCILDFFIYIGSLFTESTIEVPYNTSAISNNLIFKSYLGNFDSNKLSYIINKMYKYDNTGGINYEITNSNERQLFNLNNKPLNKIKKYINNIININEPANLTYYLYKNMIKDYVSKLYKYEKNAAYIYNNKNNGDFMVSVIKQNIVNSYKFAIANNIPLNDKINFKILEQDIEINDIVNKMIN